MRAHYHDAEGLATKLIKKLEDNTELHLDHRALQNPKVEPIDYLLSLLLCKHLLRCIVCKVNILLRVGSVIDFVVFPSMGSCWPASACQVFQF